MNKYSNNNYITPETDSTANETIADIIGNKKDIGSAGPTTLWSSAWLGYQHIHSQARVYPTLADPVNVVSSSTAVWTLGTITEIIPASTITTAFDIHYINISEISAVDDYELVLYSGLAAAEVEIARIAFSRSNNFSQEGNRPIQIPIQHPNARISAALACGDGDGASCNVKVYYHTYSNTGLIS